MAYTFDRHAHLWRRAGARPVPYSDGDQAEERLLETVRKAEDRSTFSEELRRGITDWPSEYHLSRARHCLVRPLGIGPGDKVLELGCGCGPITRYLGECGAEVTAVEGSERRARIAAERTRDLPNVRVVQDDLLEFKTGKRFDWVLLVGVLEYARVFCKKPDPEREYLAQARRLLGTSGRLVLAIENRLGLKYFNGCGEDHLGVPFFGIQDFYDSGSPATYGRSELSSLLAGAGFDRQEFLYPFPDYKLPAVVVGEAAFQQPGLEVSELLLRVPSRDYAGLNLRAFNEQLVFASLGRNGLIQHLSNSFCVVAGRTERPVADPAALAWTFAIERKKEFACQTLILRSAGGELSVRKENLFAGLNRDAALPDGARVVHRTPAESFVSGRSVLHRVVEARAKGGGLEAVIDALLPWGRYVLLNARPADGKGKIRGAQRRRVEDLVIDGAWADCTPANTIEGPEGPVYIDREWVVGEAIPLGWLLLRGVMHCLGPGAFPDDGPWNLDGVVRRLVEKLGFSCAESSTGEWLAAELRFQAAVAGTLYSVEDARRGFGRTDSRLFLPEVARLRGELLVAGEALRKNQGDLDSARVEIGALADRVSAREANRAATQDELDRARVDVALRDELLAAREKERTAALEERQRLEAELTLKGEMLAFRESALAEVVDERRRVETELELLRSRNASLLAELEEASEAGAKRDVELSILLSRNASTSAELEEASEVRRNLETELAARLFEGASLRGELEEATRELDRLRVDWARQEQELLAYEERVAAARAERFALLRRLANREAALSEEESARASLAAELEALRGVAGQQERELATLALARGRVSDLERVCSAQAVRVRRLGAALAESMKASDLGERRRAASARPEPERGGAQAEPPRAVASEGSVSADLAPRVPDPFLIVDSAEPGTRVLFISHDAHPHGAQFFLLRFLRWVRSHSDLEFEILLGGEGPLRKDFEALARVSYWNPETAGFGPLPEEDPLLRRLRASSFGLVYSNTIVNGRILAGLSGLGCPITTQVHELGYWIRNRIPQDELRAVLEHTDRFLAVSEAVRRSLVEEVGVPPGKVEVVHGFIPIETDVSGILSKRSKVRAELGIPWDAMVVGGCGTTDWRKAPDLFIQMARGVRGKMREPAVHFVWVGGQKEGPEFTQLWHDAARAGLGDVMHFVGHTPSPLDHFASFDVFALTSREDPFPLVNLEAASLGIPTVCFDGAGGAPEFVEEDCGFVVPYLDVEAMAERVTEILGSRTLRERLGRRAAEKVRQRHDIDVTAPILLDRIVSGRKAHERAGGGP